MNLQEAEALAEDLAVLRKAKLGTAKSDCARTWTKGYHHEFLDLVGNDKRQWFITWDTVGKTRIPTGRDLTLDEVLYAAENRLSTPTETASRLAAKLRDEWPDSVLKAIVDKTLDAGISVQSVRKALGAAPRRFSPSLCADWLKMSEDIQKKTLQTGRFVSTPKMDGLRCLFVLNMPGEGAFSRSMKPLKNLDKHLVALKKVFTEPCVIDGEALSASNDWAESITGTKRTGAQVQMLFYAFDYIPGVEHAQNAYTTVSEDRYERLICGLEASDPDLFRIVERSPILRTPDAVMSEHALCVGEGWEGAVLHNLDAPYACKRTRAWIKVKAWHSENLVCTGFFKGCGKHAHRLGGIIVKGMVNVVEVASEVGTGFSDEERERVWGNQDVYKNRIAEIKFFEVTPDRSLRFPSFLRWIDA